MLELLLGVVLIGIGAVYFIKNKKEKVVVQSSSSVNAPIRKERSPELEAISKRNREKFDEYQRTKGQASPTPILSKKQIELNEIIASQKQEVINSFKQKERNEKLEKETFAEFDVKLTRFSAGEVPQQAEVEEVNSVGFSEKEESSVRPVIPLSRFNNSDSVNKAIDRNEFEEAVNVSNQALFKRY